MKRKEKLIKERWKIHLDAYQPPAQTIAELVRTELSLFGEEDIEFAPSENEDYSSGSIEFNLSKPVLTRKLEMSTEKLSAASLFNRLPIKGHMVRLGLVNVRDKNEPEETNDDNTSINSEHGEQEGTANPEASDSFNSEVQRPNEANNQD